MVNLIGYVVFYVAFVTVSLLVVNRFGKRLRTPLDTPQPYDEKAVVDSRLIEGLEAKRQRPASTQYSAELAGIIEQWNPAVLAEVTPGAYNALVAAVEKQLMLNGDAGSLAWLMTKTVENTFHVTPANTEGIANYLLNWWGTKRAAAAEA